MLNIYKLLYFIDSLHTVLHIEKRFDDVLKVLSQR